MRVNSGSADVNGTKLYYETMGEGHPLVYCSVPDELVEAGTVIRQIRDISPTLRADASDLRQALLEASDNYPLDKLREIAAQVNSCPHRAADRIREEIYEQVQLSPSS